MCVCSGLGPVISGAQSGLVIGIRGDLGDFKLYVGMGGGGGWKIKLILLKLFVWWQKIIGT